MCIIDAIFAVSIAHPSKRNPLLPSNSRIMTYPGLYPVYSLVSSTTENLAVFLWESIKKHLPPSDAYELHELKVYETDKNIVVYRGE